MDENAYFDIFQSGGQGLAFVAISPEGDRNKGAYRSHALGPLALRLTLLAFVHTIIVFIIRNGFPVVNGVSGPVTTTSCGLELPKETTVLDFKFLDDKTLLVLCQNQGMSVTGSGLISHGTR